MAKPKKETSSETPIVVNWVNENASKLSEVRSMNPTLYSAITMALDYLNKSLGGVGDVVMPEVSAPSKSAVKGLQKQDLVETFIRIFDFDNFLSVQKVLMDLGYVWREDILPTNAKYNPSYRITNEDDVLDFCAKNTNLTSMFSDYEKSIIALVLDEIDGKYAIVPFFGTDVDLFNKTIVREINVLDLGLDESFLPKLKIPNIEKTVYKLLLAPFEILQRAFQIWAFDKKFEWSSGNDMRVFGNVQRWVFLVPFDDDLRYLTSRSVERYEKYEEFDFNNKTYPKKSIPDISLRMFNIKPEWESNDLFNSKFAVNKKRDLAQIKKFLLSFGFTIKVDSSKGNSAENYVLIKISDNGEISIEDYTFSAWSIINYRKIQIGDFGLPLPIQYQAQPTETVISYTDISKSWVKSDFLGKIVMVSSNAQARGFQKLVLDLGIRWADGSNTVELTRYRIFQISDEGIMFAMTDDPNSFVTKNRTNLLFFDELGVAPIKEVMTAKEIERSSIFVSNKEELNYLQEVLQNEFGFESYGTQVLPRNSVFYINVNETDFRISATPQARVLYNLSEFGKDPIYKSPDNSTDLKFSSGDRFIYNNSNVYNKALQGFETYRLNIIDSSTIPSVEVSFADNVEGSRAVNWIFVPDPDTLEDFRQKAMDGNIRILSKRPLYEEGTTVGNYEILQVGFAKNDFDEGYDFLYQTYRKDTNSFLSITETNLVKLFEMPKAPRSKNIDPLTTNLKIRINSEAESRAFQEWAFSFGIEWYSGGSNLEHLTSKYLYIDNKVLDWDDKTTTFNTSNYLEVTLADLGIVLPLETINPLSTDIKIEVNNEDEARAFQEWAFNNGVKWWSARTSNLNHLGEKYFIIDNGLLVFDEDLQSFQNSPAREVTLKDLGIVLPLETINPLSTDIKIEVNNEDEARAFQEWAFSKGVKWNGGGDRVNRLDKKYFIIESGLLMFDPDGQYMKNSPAREVTLRDLGITIPKTIVAVKKTPAPKVTTTPPLPKPDVQNLYNELDDLDI